MSEYYRVDIAGLERDLLRCPISDKLDIAAFILFGDVELTERCAEELAKLGFEIDRKIIVVSAVKEVGSYEATVKLHKEVTVKVPFTVVAEAE